MGPGVTVLPLGACLPSRATQACRTADGLMTVTAWLHPFPAGLHCTLLPTHQHLKFQSHVQLCAEGMIDRPAMNELAVIEHAAV